MTDAEIRELILPELWDEPHLTALLYTEVAVGLITWITSVRPMFWLTDKGWALAGALRRYCIETGDIKDFPVEKLLKAMK
jgi:hypothetical protein